VVWIQLNATESRSLSQVDLMANSCGEKKMEPVRLVIWDLDETFWGGTLTEGGIKYRQNCHEIILELARRGIMSSVCSKNDFEQAKKILEDNNIWQYIIFPSINWEPKGKRLTSLIDAVQLRSETVMFIDDNPMNLAEAVHYAPGIQTADDKFISELLNDVRFKGKDDGGLTRLTQYKLLEARHADRDLAGGDNYAFLRDSGVTISIDYDIERNIDRAVELVNRTNQLNFTKKRLTEDIEAARTELRSLVSRYDVYAGLVKVSDRYGDYGYVGFFATMGTRLRSTLIHFCFSCRTLNMGVETWMYRWLSRPKLSVVGEVLSSVNDDDQVVDWITCLDEIREGTQQTSAKLLDQLVLRGGCDLGAMSHYLGHLTAELYVEVNTSRDDRQIRIDHSSFLRLGFGELGTQEVEALGKIGYLPEDWNSMLFRQPESENRSVWILSFWTDSFIFLYKNRELGFVVPFLLPKDPHALSDVTALSDEHVGKLLMTRSQLEAFELLKRDYVGYGKVSEDMFRETLQLLKAKSADALMFVILGPEYWIDNKTGKRVERLSEKAVNSWIKKEFHGRSNVHLLDILDFAESDLPRSEALHFERLVYKRAADRIRAIVQKKFEKIPFQRGSPAVQGNELART